MAYMYKLILILLFINFLGCNKTTEKSWQKENKETLSDFLSALQSSLDDKLIYNKYVYINPAPKDSVIDGIMPEPQRQKEYFRIFDSTRAELKRHKYSLLLIRDAIKKFPQDSLYDTYYDGQDSITYVVHFPKKDLYALVYQKKIVSINPRIQDGKIIWWY